MKKDKLMWLACYLIHTMPGENNRKSRLKQLYNASDFELDNTFHLKLANLYESFEDEYYKPIVQHSYSLLGEELCNQYKMLEYFFPEFVVELSETEQYNSSKEMFTDVYNGHIWVLASNTDNFSDTNLLLQKSNMSFDNSTNVSYNDLLRMLHDVFGHYLHNASFGPIGEEVAYRSHAAMFSVNALSVLTTETRMQNSWFNYFGTNPTLLPKDRPFAQQKNAISPQWATKIY